ncbi:MAG: 2-phosphosulfolactate phosphatase [Limisphaerales bacterium]|jgi:2-phosphosulfolactate phosphatase
MNQIQKIDLLFGPVEIKQAQPSIFENTTCVIFDILRFTTSATMALANGAKKLFPVKTIEEALELHKLYPDSLLAGERNGAKITAELSGDKNFHLGNSPREYRKETIEGKTIISTTTNGTMALSHCKTATQVMIASFLNMRASVNWLLHYPTPRVCLVCSGTHEENSYEDMLGAGAFADLFLSSLPSSADHLAYSDSVLACRLLYQQAAEKNLAQHFALSRNGKAIHSIPALAPDVDFSAQTDLYDFAILLSEDGALRASQASAFSV